jgi:lipopolysaccharide assembly protein A
VRLFAWIIGLPLAVAVTVFAVANRAEIRFDLWPLPFGVDLPAYLAVLAPLGVGLAVGFLSGWATGLKARLRAGSLRRRLDAAEKTQSQA